MRYTSMLLLHALCKIKRIILINLFFVKRIILINVFFCLYKMIKYSNYLKP